MARSGRVNVSGGGWHTSPSAATVGQSGLPAKPTACLCTADDERIQAYLLSPSRRNMGCCQSNGLCPERRYFALRRDILDPTHASAGREADGLTSRGSLGCSFLMCHMV